MLSERRRKVLNALIEEYIATASPVSSRAIVGNHSLGVSSATVRNELYVLEEDGYVVSPHVSSGRIPTDTGYRSFVDELLENIPEETEEQKKTDEQISSELRDSADELDDLLKRTSKALNRFTDCLAVVMAPRVSKISLKQISLVPIDSSHVVVVLVVKDGRVLNTVVELNGPRGTEEVRALEAMLNREYEIKGDFDPLEREGGAGKGSDTGAGADGASTGSAVGTAGQSSGFEKAGVKGFAAAMGDSAMKDDLLKMVEAIDDKLFDEEGSRVHFNGVENLFAQPEMQKMSLAMGLARLMDDDLTMFRLLGDFVAMRGLSVRIGHENEDESLNDISVVASAYGTEDRRGTVAVIGPTRMNYSKIIDAVRSATGYLDENIKGKES